MQLVENHHGVALGVSPPCSPAARHGNQRSKHSVGRSSSDNGSKMNKAVRTFRHAVVQSSRSRKKQHPLWTDGTVKSFKLHHLYTTLVENVIKMSFQSKSLSECTVIRSCSAMRIKLEYKKDEMETLMLALKDFRLHFSLFFFLL